MDHLRRLISSALGLLLVVLAGPSVWASGVVATIPTSQSYYYCTGFCTLASGSYPTAQASCDAYLAQLKAASPQSYYSWGPMTAAPPATEPGYTTTAAAYGTCEGSVTNTNTGAQGLYHTQNTRTGYGSGPTCPSNAAFVNSVCTCNSGYVPNSAASACVLLGPPVCPVSKLGDTQLGPFTSQANMTLTWTSCQAVAATPTTAAGGCKHSYDWYFGSEAASGWYGTYRESTTGANCTPNGGGFTPEGGSGTPPPAPAPPASAPDPSAPLPTPPATSCAAGTCPGTFNGSSMCVACTGGMASAGSGTGTNNPAGAASAPSGGSGTTAGTGGGGTTPIPSGGSSLSGTTCSAGLCVTQTFIRDANGTVVGQTTTSAPLTSFCASNPGDPICVAKNTGPSGVPGTGTGASGAGTGGGGGGGSGTSTFGGSCLAGFACTGDAVQCAMARDQLLRNCALNDASTESQAGLDAMADGDSKHAAGLNRRGADTTVDIGVRAAAAWVNPYAASCPADRVFNLGSLATFTIPLSSMCTLLQAMGLALVSITVLGCSYLLVTKGV